MYIYHTFIHVQPQQVYVQYIIDLGFYAEIVTELISHGATVKEKNLLGWTPLDEAISYGDRNMSESVWKWCTSHLLKNSMRTSQF